MEGTQSTTCFSGIQAVILSSVDLRVFEFERKLKRPMFLQLFWATDRLAPFLLVKYTQRIGGNLHN
jgi:hypothetical protein